MESVDYLVPIVILIITVGVYAFRFPHASLNPLVTSSAQRYSDTHPWFFQGEECVLIAPPGTGQGH